MKIILLGGCGFIGSNLAITLKKRNLKFEIYVLDNLIRKGSELNVKRLQESEICFIRGDIRNTKDLAGLPECDLVIDASAEASTVAGLKDSPWYILENNLVGTINSLEMTRKMKAEFIFLSTSRVYPVKLLEQCTFMENNTRFIWTGDQQLQGVSSNGISENFPTEGARTMYGTSKLSSELILQEYGEYFAMPYIINRFGAVSGPWQFGKQDQGFVAHWLMSHYFNKELNYNGYGGEGKQVRDVLHVGDLVELIIDQINNFNLYRNQTFNAGGGAKNTISLMELTEMCHSISGNKVNITPGEHRDGDIRIYCTDNSKVEKINGWKPQKNIRDIICDQFKWILDHQDILKSLFFTS